MHKYCIGSILALSTACATTAVVPERLGPAESAARAAEEMGALRVPSASLHLQLARDEIQEGKRFANDGQKNRAEMMLVRAESDAELALALAREASTQATLNDTKERAKSIDKRAQ